jgi:uncharacterized protein (TIGR02246 family)
MFRCWIRRSLILLALCSMTACATVRSPEESVRAAMAEFMDGLNGLDTERMAAGFASDITAFVPVTKSERVDGKAAVVEVFRQYAAETKKRVSQTHIVPEDLRVDVRGDMAVITFNVHNPSAVSRRTFVFRREDGRWLITHFHASNVSLPSTR